VILRRQYFGVPGFDHAIFKILGQLVEFLRHPVQERFRIVLGLRLRQSAGTLSLLSVK